MKDGIVRNPEVYHVKLYAMEFLLLDVSVQNCTLYVQQSQLFRRFVISQKEGERASEGERSGSE